MNCHRIYLLGDFKWVMMHLFLKWCLCGLLCVGAVFGEYRVYDKVDQAPHIGYRPWFTGPFISPTPVNVAPSEPVIQPFLNIGANYGKYDEHWHVKNTDTMWFINPALDVQVGFSERWGLEVAIPLVSKFKGGASATRLQDISYFLGVQLSEQDLKGARPDVRFDLQGLLPTGSYQNLSPKNLGTDSTGEGSYQMGPLLIVHKTLDLDGMFLSLEASLGYLWASSLRVSGLNAYGGTHDTRGVVKPGKTWTVFLTAEGSITEQWAWGVDFEYAKQGKAIFSGDAGTTEEGHKAIVGMDKSTQLTLSPYIERTFSANLGIMGGAWFSLGGQNATAFASGFFAVTYNF